jgi:hypothetical protein
VMQAEHAGSLPRAPAEPTGDFLGPRR